MGLPKICPRDNIQTITRNSLFSYLNVYHTPNRMVLSGVGVEHQKLVELARKYFLNTKPLWVNDPNLVDKQLPQDLSLAQYTGGELKVK